MREHWGMPRRTKALTAAFPAISGNPRQGPKQPNPPIGRGYDDVDFSVLLLELAKAAGMELKSEKVTVSDGLVPRK